MTPSSSTCTIVHDEVIRVCPPFNNGSSPLWAWGSRMIVRDGANIFASVPEVDPHAMPLCNIRWSLVHRHDDGTWKTLHRGDVATEREPCPLARLPGGDLVLSIQPSIGARGSIGNGNVVHFCQPTLLRFDGDRPERGFESVVIGWDSAHSFTEHSCRALATDPLQGGVFCTDELSLIERHPHAWSFLGSDLRPIACGRLEFPMRGCYQHAIVRGKTVAVMAISDEVEPVSEWRRFKREHTGNGWDYDFRQVFFTWTPDITSSPFSPPLTVASHDETAGHITPLDLWFDEAGDAWILFIERNVWHAFFRDRFFPDLPLRSALNMVKVSHGRVTQRRTLMESIEDRSQTIAGGRGIEGVSFADPVPTWATFHAAPGGRLYVVWSQKGSLEGLFIQRVLPDSGPATHLSVSTPMSSFQAACERNGCEPSNTIDLYGIAAEHQIRYLQVRITEDPIWETLFERMGRCSSAFLKQTSHLHSE